MSTMVEGHPSTLTTNDPPSTSHTEGVGEREEEKKLNSMGRCMPKNNSQNNGSTRLAQSISDILRLTYSIAQSDLGTTGSATDPSFSSSSSSTNQDSSTHPTGRNTTTGQQKEQQQRHPMMDHRDIETLKQTLDNATRSAESISNDIDGLQLDIESLAATIGLDPTQFSEQDFAGLDAQNVFTGGHTDMMANATRNDIIQLYQLAGGSHIRNRYDASQASKGKGVASSVATPTPPSIAGDPQQQQQGGDMGLNISSAPLMADASQAVPVGTTTTPIPTDSGIPPQPDIPLSSTLTQPQLPSAPLLPPTSTDISAAATTTAFPQVGTTPVTGVSQASIPLYQPLLNTGGSSSIAAADAAATSTSVSATTNINDAAAAAPGNNNDSGLINPQMFQAFYQGIGLPQQPSQFPSTNNPGQPQQFIPIPVPIPVAVPIQQPITPLSSTATSQQIPSNTTATNLPTSTTTVPQPPPPGIPQPFPTSTVNPLIIPFINGTPYNTQQQQDENSSTINNNNPPPLSNYPPTDPSL
ncbi:hypothetical protein BDA99DRAFT_216710 [Phascolomyces articulosus]|uniref:Uncharacterized protein n=1 Tax=Phascolomyces articulosus TaxID=60185 RepID=A0AAD5P9M5_9FUNG|nr:hypothetical protein BDA99DRAFT_216710 [Phascolomyces articulosus]